MFTNITIECAPGDHTACVEGCTASGVRYHFWIYTSRRDPSGQNRKYGDVDSALYRRSRTGNVVVECRTDTAATAAVRLELYNYWLAHAHGDGATQKVQP